MIRKNNIYTLLLLVFFVAPSAYGMDNSNSSVISGSSSGIEMYRLSPELERDTTLAIIANQLGKKRETIKAYSKQIPAQTKIILLRLLTAKQKKANALIDSPNNAQADILIEKYQNCEAALANAMEQIETSQEKNQPYSQAPFDTLISLLSGIPTSN